MAKSKKRFLVILFVLVLLSLFFIPKSLFKSIAEISSDDFATPESTESIGEITSGMTIVQQFPRLYSEINSIKLQFANYSNRANKGILNIRVYDESKIVADVSYDVSDIGDCEYVSVPFDIQQGRIGEKMKIEISADSQKGSAITLCISEDSLQKIDGLLLLNGITNTKNINMKILYVSPKLNVLWWAVGIIILWLMIPLGIYDKLISEYKKNEKFKRKVNLFFEGLIFITIAFLLVSLRDLSFLTDPTIYGEEIGRAHV